MNFKNFVILFSSLILFASCENSTNSSDYQEVKLIDMTGFDGCGWVLEVQDSAKSMLEPVNLSEFNIEMIENKTIYIQYHEVDNYTSICMIGPIIKIDNIKKE